MRADLDRHLAVKAPEEVEQLICGEPVEMPVHRVGDLLVELLHATDGKKSAAELSKSPKGSGRFVDRSARMTLEIQCFWRAET